MKFLILGLFFIINFIFLNCLNQNFFGTNKAILKTGFIRPSLFHVVKFPNDECFDLRNQSGTCYTPLQCKAYKGIGTASCANGYGQCCIISRTCHNTTSQKVVYFKNQNYPQLDSNQNFCDLTIEIKDDDVCQVKLEFLDFQLDQPTDGNCLGDKLKITATGVTPNSIPTLCGTNRNQHLYVHLPADIKERSVSLLFETNNNGPFRWHIRVTQVDCNRNGHNPNLSNEIYRYKRGANNLNNLKYDLINLSRKKRSIFLTEASLKTTFPAPSGCLQYYTSKTGMIESFNFGQYFNNLDYAICIERQSNICRVIFNSPESSFGIETTNLGVQNDEGAVGDEQCNFDYLMIPGGSQNGDFPTKDRYCGSRLVASDFMSNQQNRYGGNNVITKINGPIVLRFHTDSQINSKLRIGFRIKYEQNSENCQIINNLYQPNYSTLSASNYKVMEPQALTLKLEKN